MLKIGDNAPEFCLPDQDGVEFCLKSLVGNWILLYFYPKDNTPGCTKQACELSSEMDFFVDSGCYVVGVSPDTATSHKKFINSHTLKQTLLSDKDKHTTQLYDAWGQKKLYGKEYMGLIRSSFIIDKNLKIAWMYYNVRVKEHAQKAKQKLLEIQSKS